MSERERIEFVNRIRGLSEEEVSLVVRELPVSVMIDAIRERWEAMEHKQELIDKILNNKAYE